jgi:SAM-dependent methyltransferase
MVELYRNSGLDIYEEAYYARDEHVAEIEQILTWYKGRRTRLLDVGCSGGLHALDLARREFSVTGVDIEPSAVSKAQSRTRALGLEATFKTLDIEKDDFSTLGEFNLIYSIGNVMSHVRKERIGKTLTGLRSCLESGGTLLFDVFIVGNDFQEEINDEALRIRWKRKLDPKTGYVAMVGKFLEFAFVQHFNVWAYSVDEMSLILRELGFVGIDVSDRLDFSRSGTEAPSPACLNFRASIGCSEFKVQSKGTSEPSISNSFPKL